MARARRSGPKARSRGGSSKVPVSTESRPLCGQFQMECHCTIYKLRLGANATLIVVPCWGALWMVSTAPIKRACSRRPARP
jgi:hypothetical protein